MARFWSGLVGAMALGWAALAAGPAQAALFKFSDAAAAPDDVFFQSVLGEIDMSVFPFLYDNEDRPADPVSIGTFSKPGLTKLVFTVNGRPVDTMSFIEPDELVLDLELDPTGKLLLGSIFINEIDITITMASDAIGLWSVMVSSDDPAMCGSQTEPGCRFTGFWRLDETPVVVAEPATSLGLLALGLGACLGLARRRRVA
ncbi:MAG: hypothetical protein KIT81_06910 [Alphaproteobacteria bacterium]|nr:hypothetical protein [Alphaproteobacteria bacterium]